MYIDGDRLTVSIDADLSEVMELAAFAKERMEFIEGIDLEDAKDNFGSSSLFQLLAAMKLSKPSLDIPAFSADGFKLGKLGLLKWEAAWTKNS